MTYSILNLREFSESKECPIEWGREIQDLLETLANLDNQLEQIRENLNLPFPHTVTLEDRALEVTALHDDVIEELCSIGLEDYGTSTGLILRAALGALTAEQIDSLLKKSKQDYDL